MTPLEKVALIIIIILAVIAFAGCAGMRVTGTLQTDYGSVPSDGRSIELFLPVRGYAK